MIQTDSVHLTPASTTLPAVETYVFPTSFAQQRMWFLEQLNPGTSTYNIRHLYRMQGLLDAQRLEASLNKIIARHEALRTTFAIRDGAPVQVIRSHLTLPLNRIDLTAFPHAEREAEAVRLSLEELNRPFDLEQGPLFRVTLYTLGDDCYLLLTVMHHIISDGWSLQVFHRDLAAFYTAKDSNALPELPLQYADYAVWQREWLQGEMLQKQLAYWREQLTAVPILELPTDFPRPPVLLHDAIMLRSLLPSELSRGIKALSQRQGATLFMTLLAVFDILLARGSGQTDIVVGTPIAGRNRQEIEGLIGFFLNTLVLRTRLEGDPTFTQLLARTRQTALDAYSHQDIPLEKLLEELKPARDPSRTPFFQVFLNMHIFDEVEWTLPGLDIEHLPPSRMESNFDLTVYVTREENSLVLGLVANRHLFTHERMREFLNQYVQLLSQIVANPDKAISQYTLVTPEAREILPDPRAPLSKEWHGSIQERLSQIAGSTPTQIAVTDSVEQWTYDELDRSLNQLAHYLIANGIGRGDIVAIYAHRSAGLVYALFGVLKAGAAILILDPAYPTLRLVSYLEIAGPKGWIQLERGGVLDKELEKFVGARAWNCQLNVPTKARIEASLFAPYPTDAPNVAVEADDIACISFTSGSMGKPKGVLQRHGPLTHFIPWQTDAFHLSDADRFSMLSGLSHDPLQRDIFTPIWLGAWICIPAPETIGTPGALAVWMAQQEITFAHLTPAMARLVTERVGRELSLPSLCGAFFVGDKLMRHDVESLRRLAPNVTVINSYGTTETQRAVGYAVLSTKTDTHAQKAVYPVGRGMPDVQLLIRNRGGGLAGVGEIGEIYVRSPHLAEGYLGDEELTRERFLMNPWFIINPWMGAADDRMYRTGDLGSYLPDGSLEYLGRADRQLKLRGFRIEPGEIEAVLQQHSLIRQALVVLDEKNPRGARLVAYLVASGEPPTPRELRTFLQARIPDFMTPGEFVYLPALPLTPNGKIDLEALPPPPLKPEASDGLDVPLSETERKLATIWEQVLHVSHVGRHDDFFELGGHSMLAIQLFSRIAQETGKKLPIVTLFRAPTIAELAQVIERPDSPGALQTLVPIQPGGTRRPFFCVHGLGGGVIGYAELARLLGPDQPFYGLQAKGVDGAEEPDAEIETMAARYIEALRAVQPEGPYHIGGYCYGGFVAFAMASLLERQGEQVGLLAIFEGYAIRRSEARRQTLHPLEMIRFVKNLPYWLRDYGPLKYEKMMSRLKVRGNGSWQRQILEADRGALLGPDELVRSEAIPPALRRVLAVHLHALSNYHPPRYGGQVTLFRVQAQSLWRAYDPEMGWGRLTTGGVRIVKIPGAHYNILERPYVVGFAKQLGTALSEDRA